VNSNYYRKGGPAIIYINGEGPVFAPPYNESTDFVVQAAQFFEATIVTLEHRYYGLSVPTADLSTPNLEWLTVDQALADLAGFISWYTMNYLSPDTKWITIGGSYSGALSAWFRLKYPHITVGAVSSSGVVNAIFDFTAFDEQVAKSVGSQCANALRSITSQIQTLVFQSPESNQKVKSLFQAENILVEDGDFFYYVADKMAESVQYGYQPELCNVVLSSNETSLLNAFANYVVTFAAPILGGPLGYNTAALLNVTIDEEANYRQWWWQTCSQLAYFQNAPAVGSIRSQQINMTYHLGMCNTLFGNHQTPDVNATNLEYGGNETAGTYIWFNDGSQDPWQQASVKHTISEDEEFRLVDCENCGHCVDLRGCPGGCLDDNKSLNFVRSEVLQAIKYWLFTDDRHHQ